MFKASRFEYRFRYILHAVIYILGFVAPWDYALNLDSTGPNAHVWGLLSANLSRLIGGNNITLAFNIFLSIAIVCAFAGAFLRTWGAAYLGANIVQSSSMHTAESLPPSGVQPGILQDGPFRHSRNPLYLGTFLHTLALSLLMPRSGAIFTIVLIGLLQIRLILAEEPFLAAKLGTPYLAYCKLVPRILPSLKPRIAALGLKPRWGQAILGEIYMWVVACSFAFAGWLYKAQVLEQCVLVAFGVSLLARAFTPRSFREQA